MGSGPSQPQKQQDQQQKPLLQTEKATTTTVGSAAAFLRPIRTVSTKVLTEEETKRIQTVGKHRGI